MIAGVLLSGALLSGCWLSDKELDEARVDTAAPDTTGEVGDDTAGPGGPGAAGPDDTSAPLDDTATTAPGETAGDDTGTAPAPAEAYYLADGMYFIPLEADSFTMGCTTNPSACEDDEEPPHVVNLTRGFWIAETEMTNRAYKGLMGSVPAEEDTGVTANMEHPVTLISWNDVARAANALSSEEGLPECFDCSGEDCELAEVWGGDVYACEGYRLPTEAEWEYAARCGEDTTYAGSDVIDDVAWYDENSCDEETPCGESSTRYIWPVKSEWKQPNACGLYDMSGNASEWVYDWYNAYYYDSSPTDDPQGAGDGEYRGLRGGCYACSAATSRNSGRRAYEPANNDLTIGFRLARSIP